MEESQEMKKKTDEKPVNYETKLKTCLDLANALLPLVSEDQFKDCWQVRSDLDDYRRRIEELLIDHCDDISDAKLVTKTYELVNKMFVARDQSWRLENENQSQFECRLILAEKAASESLASTEEALEFQLDHAKECFRELQQELLNVCAWIPKNLQTRALEVLEGLKVKLHEMFERKSEFNKK